MAMTSGLEALLGRPTYKLKAYTQALQVHPPEKHPDWGPVAIFSDTHLFSRYNLYCILYYTF